MIGGCLNADHLGGVVKRQVYGLAASAIATVEAVASDKASICENMSEKSPVLVAILAMRSRLARWLDDRRKTPSSAAILGAAGMETRRPMRRCRRGG